MLLVYDFQREPRGAAEASLPHVTADLTRMAVAESRHRVFCRVHPVVFHAGNSFSSSLPPKLKSDMLDTGMGRDSTLEERSDTL